MHPVLLRRRRERRGNLGVNATVAVAEVTVQAPGNVHAGERLDRVWQLGQDVADVLREAAAGASALSGDEDHLEPAPWEGGVGVIVQNCCVVLLCIALW